jgi:hypothetical protein
MIIRQIAEGWFNDFLKDVDLLDEKTKALGENRMNICADCPVRTSNTCDHTKRSLNIHGVSFNGCGCRVDKKALCIDCSCPGGFW